MADEQHKISKPKTQTVESSIALGNRVQYIGTTLAAYRGQPGMVKAMYSNTCSILFDGASIPIEASLADVIPLADPNASDPNALMTSTKPRFRYIVNTSGGLLVIGDLKNATNEEGIALQPGEKIDLLSFFDVKEINRAQSLVRATIKISEATKLPMVTVLSSLDDPIPTGSIIEPMGTKLAPGTQVEAARNEYDDKLDADIQKEIDRNLKLAAMSRRRTPQHGRGSSGLGG